MMNNNLIGSQLGKYEIQNKIGQGGMGTVYKGYDPLLDRYVAVKVLAPHLVWEQEFVERFLREARSAARMKHPHIVTIHDVGQEGSLYYFVMEYVEGRSLDDVIRQQETFPPHKALAILRPLADALDYAHHRGLVHRDVKPANIIISTEGQAILTDFGIARAAQETRLTATGTLVGTPEYMSPEQVQGLTVDARSDQYSLAVVAYEMLGGRVPYQAESTLALMYKIAHEPLPSIRQARPDLPMGVEAVMKKALAKEPGDRYTMVSDFVEALERALAGEEVVKAETLIMKPEAITASPAVTSSASASASASARPTAPPVASEAKSVSVRKRVPVWGWALGGVAILTLAIGIAMGIGRIGDRSTPTPSVRETTPVSISEDIDTPLPSPTATATRQPTRTPTRTPTHTPTPMPTATLTPVPRTNPPTLLAPIQGYTYRSPITFQWQGSINTNQTYQVTAYHVQSGYTTQSDPLRTTSWTVALPGEKFGEWHWRVAVIQNGKEVTTSAEWMFWFDPFASPLPTPSP